jgi:hypothetical protein
MEWEWLISPQSFSTKESYKQLSCIEGLYRDILVIVTMAW